MKFAYPYFLLLLLLLAVPAVLRLLKRYRAPQAQMRVPTLAMFASVPPTWRMKLRWLPTVLGISAYVLAVIALARPQTRAPIDGSRRQGIDIMLTLDISASMLNTDVLPNRIYAARKVAHDFISSRPNDNIGLTLFGGEAFLQCPLTADHNLLQQMLGEAGPELQENGIIDPGTAIGMGLASAVTHMVSSPVKSKVIILLTDGENNSGYIAPLAAAQMAKQKGIRVYTVYLGTDAYGQLQAERRQRASGNELAERDVLDSIASYTGGKSYLAQDMRSLEEVYDEIDQLEKTKLNTRQYARWYEAFSLAAWLLLAALLLRIVLSTTWLRRLP